MENGCWRLQMSEDYWVTWMVLKLKMAREVFSYLKNQLGEVPKFQGWMSGKELQDMMPTPHVRSNGLSREPPGKERLRDDGHTMARSSGKGGARVTVKVTPRVVTKGGKFELKSMKSTENAPCQHTSTVEVDGETSGVLSENEAMKRGLGKEATDETNGQDITAMEMANIEADGGDTEICHTSNRLEHKQLKSTDNERLAGIVEAKVLPSGRAPGYPQAWRTELKGEWDGSCASSIMDQPSSSTDVPQHYIDDPSGNTKDASGSTSVLQHHTGDPGCHTHERRAKMSATDTSNCPQPPANHLREGISTTAVKQHVGADKL
ncbi:hypothetical protein BKA82DRAFT_4019293 [Pisolithus tinctorius]|nr:hypothetical protein BKA82DRAFT_4019293 [Pisolithus tinctorius]